MAEISKEEHLKVLEENGKLKKLLLNFKKMYQTIDNLNDEMTECVSEMSDLDDDIDRAMEEDKAGDSEEENSKAYTTGTNFNFEFNTDAFDEMIKEYQKRYGSFGTEFHGFGGFDGFASGGTVNGEIDKHFGTLNIPKTRDKNTIKTQYHKLAKKWHPDKPEGSEEKFKNIQQAYTACMAYA